MVFVLSARCEPALKMVNIHSLVHYTGWREVEKARKYHLALMMSVHCFGEISATWYILRTASPIFSKYRFGEGTRFDRVSHIRFSYVRYSEEQVISDHIVGTARTSRWHWTTGTASLAQLL